ncbi:hypothetical protein C0J52_06227 [Blattella germanica]|nr:hypothetical protein C0J52_06227 [Blattella germanica]
MICSVPGCRSNHHKGPYVTVFKFPQDEETRKAWLEKIPRKYLKVTRNTAVCINHFREEEIVRELRVTRPDGTELVLPRKKMKLKTDAVPSIFPSIPKHTLNKQVGLFQKFSFLY